MPSSIFGSISFGDMVKIYLNVQSAIIQQVKQVASRPSIATPGRFLLLQFGMGNTASVGDSISNMISNIQSMIMNMIRNQKVS